MVVHPFGPGFTCPALLRDRVAPSGLGSRTGCHPLRPALPCRSAPQPDLRPGAAAPGCASCNPVGGTPAGYACSTVWPSVPFARRYWESRDFFLFLRVLRCFSSLVVLPPPMCSAGDMHTAAWFAHSEIPRVEGCVLLAGDYRSLPRPSSAPLCQEHPPCACGILRDRIGPAGYPRVANC